MAERPQSAIDPIIAQLYDRITRFRQVRNLAVEPQLLRAQDLRNLIDHTSTKIARSEYLVTQEAIVALQTEIDTTRGFIFQNGQDWTKLPDQEYVKLGPLWPMTEEEMKNRYSYMAEGFSSEADLVQIRPDNPPNQVGRKLNLYVYSRPEIRNYNVGIDFYFDGTFDLEVDF